MVVSLVILLIQPKPRVHEPIRNSHIRLPKQFATANQGGIQDGEILVP
jgi:hypothetical protein